MDHPDIIHYLSKFLNSKSLAMFSNTNQLIHSIANPIYLQRSIKDHVLSMMNIYLVTYEYKLNHPIVLMNEYKGYKKSSEIFFGRTTFRNNSTKIIFTGDYVYIHHKQLLTLNDIQDINKTFNINIQPIQPLITNIYTHNKSVINYVNTEKRYLGYYDPHRWGARPYIFSDLNFNIELNNLLMISAVNFDILFKICKQLL
jgi:hypothetical protein